MKIDRSFLPGLQLAHDLAQMESFPVSWEDSLERLIAQAKAAPEDEPVAHQFQGRDGEWFLFVNKHHYESTVADGTWPIRALYTHPTPAAESPAGQVSVPVKFPNASDDEIAMGWEYSYEFLSQVEKLAGSRTDYSTSMEATQEILKVACELLSRHEQRGGE